MVGAKQFLYQGVAQFHPEQLNQRASGGRVAIDSEAKAEAEFCIVFEQRIGPGRTASAAIRSVRSGGQVAPVDRRAAGGVGDQQPIAKKLGE